MKNGGAPVKPAPVESRRARVDLHLHSRASSGDDSYGARALAIPESYSDPFENYRLLRSRGMDLVTLTDTNSIDGVLALRDAGLEGIFLSTKLTCTFPEDGCKIQVIVLNIEEAEFEEAVRLRGDVYELVSYLEERAAARPLAYFLAHPLTSSHNRPYGREGSLSVPHVEKSLLLFDALEVRNGTHSRAINRLTARLVSGLDRDDIAQLAERHGLDARGTAPWQKALIGGSGDISGINPGHAWTEFDHDGDRPTVEDLIAAIRGRRTRAGGKDGGPITLAHSLLKLFHDAQTSAHRSPDTPQLKLSGPFSLLLGVAFESESATLREKAALRLKILFQNVVSRRFGKLMRRPESFESILLDEAQRLLGEESFRQRLDEVDRADDKMYLIFSSLLNRLFARQLQRIRKLSSANVAKAVKEVIALVSSNVLMSLPYYLCYSQQGADKNFLRDVRKTFALDDPEKLVLVTDTFFEINGVALTIRKIIGEAERRGIDLTVVTCLSAREREEKLEDDAIADLVRRGRLVIFESIVSMEMPEYPDLQVRLMPFLDFLKFVQEGSFTKMQISTPGPIGTTGLMAAKLLQIETSSTYHTSFPEYVENYTNDVHLEALTWKLMIQFYHAVDEVVVPSRFISHLLHERGLRNRNLLVLDRWVDLKRFAPEKRREGYWSENGIANEADKVKYVYVGRLGAEKNLDLLVEAFRRLHAEAPDTHLVFIGDGPFRGKLEELSAGLPVTFTGFLSGDELPRALASADVKVFPSTTDTWGNAPLEAQAAGLPVIVTDKGGPQELMEDGVTGFRVAGGSVPALLDAMRRFLDPTVRRTIAAAARRWVEENDITEPFSAILDSTGYRRRRQTARLLEDLIPRDEMVTTP